MPEECYNCKPICESLMRGNEPADAQMKILRFITQFRENQQWTDPCFEKICMPLLLALGVKDGHSPTSE